MPFSSFVVTFALARLSKHGKLFPLRAAGIGERLMLPGPDPGPFAVPSGISLAGAMLLACNSIDKGDVQKTLSCKATSRQR